MALWKARGGSLDKELDLDYGIVDGQGRKVLIKRWIFRSWHCGRQGESLKKEFDFRSWHCGKATGGKFK